MTSSRAESTIQPRPSVPSRIVAVGDGRRWLPTVAGQGAVVTSPPDAEEIGARDLERYAGWMADVVTACFEASTGPTIFVVTDRKAAGRWHSKALAIVQLADRRGHPLLWHRIALRRAPGGIDLHRPTYTHILCFGPGRPGRARPDVIPAGQLLWRNGTPLGVADLCAEYLAEIGAPALIDPFCGTGALLAAANRARLDALGCELDPARAEEARRLA